MASTDQKPDAVFARISEDQAWIRIQQKTFTRWCNTFLSERMMEAKDLSTAFADGILFINLLEEISGKVVAKRYNKKPKIRAQMLENLKFCFDFLKREKIKLVALGPEDLADGNLKLILGLVWTLILRFQINQGDGSGSAKSALLEWVRSKIPDYDINNFTRDWQDGKAICALANAVEDGVLDLNDMNDDPLHNATMGIDAGADKMNIPRVLDPEDMVSDKPDEHANMTYISYYRDYLDRCKSEAADRKIRETPIASKCIAYGPGLDGGESGIPTEFTIEAINDKGTRVPIGGTPFDVTMKDVKGNPVEFQLEDKEDGTYLVNYTPLASGVQTVAVTLADTHIKGSVFNVYISPATVDVSKCEAFGPGLEGATVGEEAPFTVVLKNRNGDNLNASADVDVVVTDPHGSSLPVEKKDNGDGTYSMSYKATDVGRHEIAVSHKDEPIGASPFVIEAELADGAADAGKCYAEGPGLEAGNTTAAPAVFTVHTVDKNGEHIKTGGQPVDVTVTGPDGNNQEADIKDNDDGTFTCQYQPEEPGTYKVDVIIRTADPLYYHHVKDSPFEVVIEAGSDASKCTASGPGLENGILDTKPTHFTIQAIDKNGNPMAAGDEVFDVKITDADGNDVPSKITDNGDGTYLVEYQPNGPGRQEVNVNLRGSPIKDAPFVINIKAGARANMSIVEEFTFVVQTKTSDGSDKLEGGEDFSCTIAGPEETEVDVKTSDLGNGKYLVSYKLPEVEGEYVVTATINGDNIKGSPWKQFV